MERLQKRDYGKTKKIEHPDGSVSFTATMTKEEADKKLEMFRILELYSRESITPFESKRKYTRLATPTSIARAMFDFVLPIVNGIFTIWVLMSN